MAGHVLLGSGFCWRTLELRRYVVEALYD